MGIRMTQAHRNYSNYDRMTPTLHTCTCMFSFYNNRDRATHFRYFAYHIQGQGHGRFCAWWYIQEKLRQHFVCFWNKKNCSSGLKMLNVSLQGVENLLLGVEILDDLLSSWQKLTWKIHQDHPLVTLVTNSYLQHERMVACNYIFKW